MPRCRKSYRGSRSKAQVPGLSSFPLLIRSRRSFISFLSVHLLDRSMDRSGNFILSAARRVCFFSPPKLVPHLMFQLVSPASSAVVVVDAAANVNRPCANVSQFKPFISGEKFQERSNTAAIANRGESIHVCTYARKSYLLSCLLFERRKEL